MKLRTASAAHIIKIKDCVWSGNGIFFPFSLLYSSFYTALLFLLIFCHEQSWLSVFNLLHAVTFINLLKQLLESSSCT